MNYWFFKSLILIWIINSLTVGHPNGKSIGKHRYWLQSRPTNADCISTNDLFCSCLRFVGCISGVKYSDAYGHFTFAVLKNTSGTTADCKRACTRPYEFIMKCKHGERCGNKITECDCLETGYEGQDCTRGRLKKSIFLKKSQIHKPLQKNNF
jgi:hypothetical protein